MFGIVVPDKGKLTETQWNRYHALYCGLCRTLQQQYGLIPRMALSYDMTFLILLHHSLSEPEESTQEKRCFVHPLKKRTCSCSAVSNYAAAMNTALAYYKSLDDWHDDKNVFALLQAALLRPSMQSVKRAFPEKCTHIATCLSNLAKLEQSNILDADVASKAFGRLTAELFVIDPQDHWSSSLRKLGDALGRFIYLSDALCDLSEDVKKGRYNPLSASVDPNNEENFLPALQLIAGDCAAELERLPLVQDLDILRNIIYSGIWTSYTTHRKKKEKRKE